MNKIRFSSYRILYDCFKLDCSENSKNCNFKLNLKPNKMGKIIKTYMYTTLKTYELKYL